MRKKKTISTVLITILITFLIVGGVGFFIHHNAMNKKEAEINTLKNERADVYYLVFNKDLKEGSVITADDFESVAFKKVTASKGMYITDGGTVFATRVDGEIEYIMDPTTQEQRPEFQGTSVAIEDEIIGRIIKTTVFKNTPIMESLLYTKFGPDEKDVRIEELSENYLKIPADLVEGDFFDIRITFPEGQDYIVLTGKRVEKLPVDDGGNPMSSSIYTKLTEEDYMLLNSAIVEAYMQDGVRLYATRYTEPYTQLYKETIEDYIQKYEDGVKAAIEYRRYDEAMKKMMEDGTVAKIGDVEITNYDDFKALTEAEKKAFTEGIPDYKESDFTIERIASADGIPVYHAEAIQRAKANSSDAVLTYYRAIRVQTRKDMAKTYAVKDEVLQVVKANPNLIDTIKAEFDTRALANTRIDKYKQLQNDLAKANEGYGMYNGKTADQIQSEMDQLLTTRAASVEQGISDEVTAQRARRVAYLQSLINN